MMAGHEEEAKRVDASSNALQRRTKDALNMQQRREAPQQGVPGAKVLRYSRIW